MMARRVARPGDVYWIDPNPVAGREMQGRHRFVVISAQGINALGIAITVPVTSGGQFARRMGLTVPIQEHDTQGVAVCNQVRSFDLEAREKNQTARYVESLDSLTTAEIIARVVSILDPAP